MVVGLAKTMDYIYLETQGSKIDPNNGQHVYI
jgi:hypothetical protein